jgi:hypothetical protein
MTLPTNGNGVASYEDAAPAGELGVAAPSFSSGNCG